jgi:hypothetical protein
LGFLVFGELQGLRVIRILDIFHSNTLLKSSCPPPFVTPNNSKALNHQGSPCKILWGYQENVLQKSDRVLSYLQMAEAPNIIRVANAGHLFSTMVKKYLTEKFVVRYSKKDS